MGHSLNTEKIRFSIPSDTSYFIMLVRKSQAIGRLSGRLARAWTSYAATSYMQYLEVYQVMESNADSLIAELENRKTEHSSIMDYLL